MRSAGSLSGPLSSLDPAFIGGVAPLIHAVTTYVPVFSPEWAERRAARMVERDRR